MLYTVIEEEIGDASISEDKDDEEESIPVHLTVTTSAMIRARTSTRPDSNPCLRPSSPKVPLLGVLSFSEEEKSLLFTQNI